VWTTMKSEAVQEEKSESILHKEYHARLLEDIEHFADVANVPVSMIHEPLAKYCNADEVSWVKAIMLHRENGIAGLCLTGIDKSQPVETKMWAMGAALLRNYIDARVVTMGTLLEEHKEGEVESPTVLLIPNLYVEYAGGKPNTNWQVNILQDILMRRLVEKKTTIIYVQSIEGLKKNFGEGIGVFIEAHWHIL
jgi:hypothetical protein